MTFAHNPVLTGLLNAEFISSPLQEKVHRAVASHTEFGPNSVITQDNRVKYTNAGREEAGTDHLDEVFQLMKQLNEIGVGNDTLGRLTGDGLSFRDALQQACSQLSVVLGGQPLVYVELGPEPTKTSFIIKTLLQLGVMVDRYIAVDINPVSSKKMRPVLQTLLPGRRLDFVTTSFEAFSLGEYLEDKAPPALVTMLGFQEGNDEPEVVNGWLRNIARPGDFLLSESQLLSANQAENISTFYGHPAMRRFSRIAFEQAIDRALPTLNRFFLLPVPFVDRRSAYVAILGEEFISTTKSRSLYISNFCLKLTLEQYRFYRQNGGHFKIIGETLTDDKTLHFQLSQRS